MPLPGAYGPGPPGSPSSQYAFAPPNVPITLRSNAEGQTVGTNITAANSSLSGNGFDTVTDSGTGAVLQPDTTHVAHGTQSYQIATGATAVQCFATWSTAQQAAIATWNPTWFRFYFYSTGTPAANSRLFNVSDAAGVICGALRYDTTTGFLRIINATNAQVGSGALAIPVNQWVRIEGWFTGGASGQAHAELYTTLTGGLPQGTTPDDSFTTSVSNFGNPLAQSRIGQSAGSQANYGPFWFDECAVSNAGPLGPVPIPTAAKVYELATGAIGTSGTGHALVNSTSAGDTIAVVLNASNTTGATVSDSQGNTYVSVTNDTASAVGLWVATYKGSPGTPTAALTAGTDTITPTGSFTSGDLTAVGVPGMASTAPDSAPAFSKMTAVNQTGPTTGALASPGEVVLAAFGGTSTLNPLAWGNGFTELFRSSSGGGCTVWGFLAPPPNQNAIAPTASLLSTGMLNPTALTVALAQAVAAVPLGANFNQGTSIRPGILQSARLSKKPAFSNTIFVAPVAAPVIVAGFVRAATAPRQIATTTAVRQPAYRPTVVIVPRAYPIVVVRAPQRIRPRPSAYAPVIRVQPVRGSLVQAVRGPPLAKSRRPAFTAPIVVVAVAPPPVVPAKVTAKLAPVTKRARPTGFRPNTFKPTIAVVTPIMGDWMVVAVPKAPVIQRRLLAFKPAPFVPAAPAAPKTATFVLAETAGRPPARRRTTGFRPVIYRRPVASSFTRAAVTPTRKPSLRPRTAFAPVIKPPVAAAPVIIGRFINALRKVRLPRYLRPYRYPHTIPPPPTVRPPQHLGGTAIDQNFLGGTATNSNALGGTATNANAFGMLGTLLGGTATNNNPIGGGMGGTVTGNQLGGTIIGNQFGAVIDGWTMISQDLTVGQYNDETIALAITSGGSPLNLTGLTIEAYFKPTAAALDTDVGVTKLSTVTGEIVVTNAAGGLANMAIANGVLTLTSTPAFWRLDIVNAGKRNTVMFGAVKITDL